MQNGSRKNRRGIAWRFFIRWCGRTCTRTQHVPFDPYISILLWIYESIFVVIVVVFININLNILVILLPRMSSERPGRLVDPCRHVAFGRHPQSPRSDRMFKGRARPRTGAVHVHALPRVVALPPLQRQRRRRSVVVMRDDARAARQDERPGRPDIGPPRASGPDIARQKIKTRRHSDPLATWMPPPSTILAAPVNPLSRRQSDGGRRPGRSNAARMDFARLDRHYSIGFVSHLRSRTRITMVRSAGVTTGFCSCDLSKTKTTTAPCFLRRLRLRPVRLSS
jgi:hypothetical protein